MEVDSWPTVLLWLKLGILFDLPSCNAVAIPDCTCLTKHGTSIILASETTCDIMADATTDEWLFYFASRHI